METKTAKECTRCKTTKELSLFNKDSSRVDGLCKWCKDCSRKQSKKYRDTNLDNIKVKSKIYYEKNKEKIKQKNAQKYIHNKKKILKKNLEWRENNKERRAKYMADYAKKNKHLFIASNMRRYTNTKNRVPSWVTKDELIKISSVYKEAKKMTEETGVRHQVDHIVPLQGKNVSGLHVLSNLQVLTYLDNVRKKNKYDDWSDYA